MFGCPYRSLGQWAFFPTCDPTTHHPTVPTHDDCATTVNLTCIPLHALVFPILSLTLAWLLTARRTAYPPCSPLVLVALQCLPLLAGSAGGLVLILAAQRAPHAALSPLVLVIGSLGTVPLAVTMFGKGGSQGWPLASKRRHDTALALTGLCAVSSDHPTRFSTLHTTFYPSRLSVVHDDVSTPLSTLKQSLLSSPSHTRPHPTLLERTAASSPTDSPPALPCTSTASHAPTCLTLLRRRPVRHCPRLQQRPGLRLVTPTRPRRSTSRPRWVQRTRQWSACSHSGRLCPTWTSSIRLPPCPLCRLLPPCPLPATRHAHRATRQPRRRPLSPLAPPALSPTARPRSSSLSKTSLCASSCAPPRSTTSARPRPRLSMPPPSPPPAASPTWPHAGPPSGLCTGRVRASARGERRALSQPAASRPGNPEAPQNQRNPKVPPPRDLSVNTRQSPPTGHCPTAPATGHLDKPLALCMFSYPRT